MSLNSFPSLKSFWFRPEREQREKEILEVGVPAYTTAVGWLGYSDQKIREVVYFENFFETFFTI